MSKDFDPKATKQYAERETRRLEAYQAWLGGKNYREIAEEFGYSDRASAMRAVKLARASFVEDAAEARDQATERIMTPLMVMRTLATEGDPAAANAYKGLEERLSKLHGLDMPVKTDITSDGEKITINVVPDWQTPA